MKDSFKQSMDWLHTWGGLLFGWLLFVIFFTGTLTVFDKEITYWMQPELHHLTPGLPDIESATQELARLAPHAERWWVELPHAREPVIKIYWEQAGTSETRQLEPVSATRVQPRATQGGDFFYRFHYQLHLDRPGIWIVGAAAMVMLGALVSGVIIHRRIFKDFFTFRPTASSHRAWLDVHNIAGVLVLPFHFMITFTGLIIFWPIYMPAGVDLFFKGDEAAAYAQLEQKLERFPAHVPAPLLPLADLERRAQSYWREGTTQWIDVKHPGDRHALVEITRLPDDQLALVSDRVTFDGATGDVLQVWKGDQPAFLTYSVMMGLHYIWFDKSIIRWLYFLMGLSATAMIATGLRLWTVKRRERHPSNRSLSGYRFVESLTVIVVMGLPVAVAVYFWANRLLPIELPEPGVLGDVFIFPRMGKLRVAWHLPSRDDIDLETATCRHRDALCPSAISECVDDGDASPDDSATWHVEPGCVRSGLFRRRSHVGLGSLAHRAARSDPRAFSRRVDHRGGTDLTCIGSRPPYVIAACSRCAPACRNITNKSGNVHRPKDGNSSCKLSGGAPSAWHLRRRCW